MKTWSLLYFLCMAVFMNTAHAGVYQCGAHGLENKTQIRAHDFFASIQGRFQLGRCFIELKMCDPSQPLQEGSVVGDMIVTDRHNRSFYVNFDFSNLRTRKVRRLILNGKRMVHYEYIERLPDEASGRTEAYRLEVLKSEDLQRVVSLHLGVYTSRRAKSYWVICEP